MFYSVLIFPILKQNLFYISLAANLKDLADFVNIHRPFGLAPTPYVFYTVL